MSGPPSEARTLFYSPYYDVPSDLGFPPAPRSTAGTAHSAAPSSTRGVLAKEDVSLRDQRV